MGAEPTISSKLDELSRFVADARAQRSEAPESGRAFPPGRDLLDDALAELHVAEEELRVQMDELEEARRLLEIERARYTDLFDWAPEPYVVTDRHGVLQEANHAAAELLNVSSARLVGKPLLYYVARRDCPAFRTFVAAVAQSKGVQRTVLHLRARGEGKGTFRTVLSARTQRGLGGSAVAIRWLLRPAGDDPVSDADSRVQGLRCKADELEIRLADAERSLAASRAEHRRATERQADGLRTLGDLREAMLATRQWRDIIAARPEGDSSGRPLNGLLRGADHMLALVEKLLGAPPAVARSGAAVRPLDMAPLVTKVLEGFRQAAEFRGVDLVVTLEPCVAMGEPRLMHQAVWELMAIAVRSSVKGTAIRVDLREAQEHACLVIQSRGAAVVSEDLAGEPSGIATAGGVQDAVGVSVAQAIVTHFGGILRIEEGQGRGAVITCLLSGRSGKDEEGEGDRG